ncbi:protein-disulfide reductase DsbD [Motilimonas pumila]|nr:protein-disulfide reductase DsbD [Motilimonas pumila]
MRSLLIFLFACWANINQVNAADPFAAKSQTPFDQGQTEFLSVEQAFEFSSLQQGNQLTLFWRVTPEHYLYQHQFEFSVNGAQFTQPTLPAGKPYQDEYFGEVVIYDTDVSITVDISQVSDNGTLAVTYQGCAKAGLCYPPETKDIPLDPISGETVTSSSNTANTTATGSSQASEQGQLADLLSEQSLAISLALFFVLGLGLAFTPCVFPMYPILSGIIVGQKQPLNSRRSFLLAMSYVQGMALTYTLLGLVVASAGMQYQAAFQHPVVLIGLAILFTVLAAAMFGAFNLQLPSTLTNKLNQLSGQQQGGNSKGVFVMGMISGLVCSPCTTAPLSGVLLYVASSGDLVIGGAVLYALSLGMGLPLLVLGASGGRFLPKAGVWMQHIKVVFGFLLLSVSVMMLGRFIADEISLLLYAGLALALLVYLAMASRRSQSKHKTWHVLALMLALAATAGVTYQQWPSAELRNIKQRFVQVNNTEQLAAQLALAKANQQAVMLDFYADWCVACKDFEKDAFANLQVQAQLANVVLIQADVTKNNKAHQAMLAELSILGLPSILFYDAQGQALDNARVTGFMPAAAFLAHLKQYQVQ